MKGKQNPKLNGPVWKEWLPPKTNNRLGQHYQQQLQSSICDNLLIVYGGILVHSSLQNCCNSATLEGFRAWTAFLRFKVGLRSGLWLGHSKVFSLFFFSHSEVDLLVCFGSLSCCIMQVRFRLEATNRCLNVVLQDFLVDSRISFITASLPGPEAAKQPQTIILPPTYFTVGMMFFFWNAVTFTPDLMWHTPFKKLIFSLVIPQSVGDHQVFWQNLDEPLCSFWSAVVFVLERCHAGSSRCALGIILVGRPLLGRFSAVPCFRHSWIMALPVVRWSPKAVEMAL